MHRFRWKLLEPGAREFVGLWEKMNQDIAVNATVIAVTSKSAVVRYPQGQSEECMFFFFIPRGESEPILVYDLEILPRQGNTHYDRVKKAVHDWRLFRSGQEKQTLLSRKDFDNGPKTIP